MNKYPKNRKKHNYKICGCASCKSKRGESSGKNHPLFGLKKINAITNKKYYCECGNEISYQSALYEKGRCEQCGRISATKTRQLTGKCKGENHYNWQGGITSIYERIRNLEESNIWRTEVFERDNYTCQECGDNKGRNLNVHHDKISFSELISAFLSEYNQFSVIDDKEILVRLAMNWKPFWNINNGKTLCEDCHKEKHSKFLTRKEKEND